MFDLLSTSASSLLCLARSARSQAKRCGCGRGAREQWCSRQRAAAAAAHGTRVGTIECNAESLLHCTAPLVSFAVGNSALLLLSGESQSAKRSRGGRRVATRGFRRLMRHSAPSPCHDSRAWRFFCRLRRRPSTRFSAIRSTHDHTSPRPAVISRWRKVLASDSAVSMRRRGERRRLCSAASSRCLTARRSGQ